MGTMFDIREIKEEDLPDVFRLEQAIFSDAWSEESLTQSWAQGLSLMLGAWQEERLIGYLLFQKIPPEGEILKLAVEEDCRRQGAAREMMAALFGICRREGITKLMLEVRRSNAGAVAFYKTCGFHTDGVRRDYYEKPIEDALLMSRGR